VLGGVFLRTGSEVTSGGGVSEGGVGGELSGGDRRDNVGWRGRLSGVAVGVNSERQGERVGWLDVGVDGLGC